MDARKQIGLQGEKEAASFLRQRGYKIIDHRARILNGDIDIIALDNRTVVFVEVRSRTNTKHGHPVETINSRKKRRIVYLANAYIKQHKLKNCSYRIDVVTVLFVKSDSRQKTWWLWRFKKRPLIEHFQNAFDSNA
ncbi:MAG: YraN family protein [Planctomycetaceae bacterium]|nr:YraN family protein [Planctomycetaceae bacterium]MBT7727610.1 YraN family protein [Planctomycetaceae bacterium]